MWILCTLRSRGAAAVAAAVALVGLLLSGCDRRGDGMAPESPSEVTLYFSDRATLERSDCAAVLPSRRRSSGAESTPTGLLRTLLRGVDAKERAAGMSSHFEPTPALHPAGTRPLLAYLRGVEVEAGVAWVDFEPGGLAYLGNASCAQAAVKSPIEHTLLALPAVSEVRYRIQGVPFDTWDA